MSKINIHIEKYLSSILFIAALFLSVIILWGFNKGFDFSDEGFLLMGLTNPHNIHSGGVYELIFYKLFHIINPGLLFYRVIRFILILLGIAYLYTCILNYFKSIQKKINDTNKVILISILLIGTLSSYALYSSIISYNNLTLILGMFISGLFIEILISTSNKHFFKHLLLCSILISYQLLTRFPTALILATFFVIVILISSQKTTIKIAGIICSLFILVFSLQLYLFFINSNTLIDYYLDYKQAISFMSHHDSNTLLEMYQNSMNYCYEHAISFHYKLFWILVISSIFSRILKKYPLIQKALFFIQCLLLLVYCKKIYDQKQYYSGMIYSSIALEPYLFLGLSFLYINIISLNFSFKNILHFTSIIVLFILFPFICSIGTNNELPLQCLQFMAFWILIFFFFYIYNYENTIVRKINLVYLLIICGLAFSHTITGYIYHPYRITSNLNNNTLYFENKLLSNIKTDKNTLHTLNNIEQIIAKNNPEKKELQIIDFCKIPGIVYALNGYTPRNAWIARNAPLGNVYYYQSAQKFNRYYPDYIFIPSPSINELEINEYFTKIQININKDFEFIDSVKHPLYNYDAMPMKENILIYSKRK